MAGLYLPAPLMRKMYHELQQCKQACMNPSARSTSENQVRIDTFKAWARPSLEIRERPLGRFGWGGSVRYSVYCIWPAVIMV